LSLISRIRVVESQTKRSYDEFGRIKKVPSKPTIAQKVDLNIKNLPSGNYLLIWDLIDSSSKIVGRTQKSFQKSNPNLKTDDLSNPNLSDGRLDEELAKMNTQQCRMMVASLLPIATASEQSTVDFLRKKGSDIELRNYLKTFWARKNKENPARPFLEFRELMALGENKYATKTMPAYQTDRGRVLLQYGKPNMIENEFSDRFRKAMQNLNTVPYEIWYYYSLETPVKQNDVIFVFVQENRGNENYRLLHSTGIGEVRNREWRKAVETNATYNYDRLSPDDRYDPNDSKKYR
jgi:GWxTD domain-containing protein